MSTHPLEASEKNVSKIIIINIIFLLQKKIKKNKNPVKAKLCWPTEAELMFKWYQWVDQRPLLILVSTKSRKAGLQDVKKHSRTPSPFEAADGTSHCIQGAVRRDLQKFFPV